MILRKVHVKVLERYDIQQFTKKMFERCFREVFAVARRMLALFFCLIILFSVTGCGSILEDEKYTFSPHDEVVSTSEDSVIEAESYEELRTAILSFIEKHEETGLIRVYSYPGNIDEDVVKVCDDVRLNIPLGAYATSEIMGSVRKVVSYYEVQLEITYTKTKDQIEDIITASTLRYLKSELKDMLSSYEKYGAISADISGITEADIREYVNEAYYENPLEIVMIPLPTFDFYPKEGADKIIEFKFGYIYEASTLQAMENSMRSAVQSIAESAGGVSDGAVLLSLGERLIEKTEYNDDAASSGDITNQSIAATAYGALVNGAAVSEGYAMAYKALCDELGLECYVVIGALGSDAHAWNIVALDDGNYYHIDMSQCDVNGMKTAFLKNDTDMKAAGYVWSAMNYKVCNGPLTYESIKEASD
jgi:hypothetical protein